MVAQHREQRADRLGLLHDLVEPEDAERHGHEVADVALPHLSQQARGRGQQVAQQRVAAAALQDHPVGEGADRLDVVGDQQRHEGRDIGLARRGLAANRGSAVAFRARRREQPWQDLAFDDRPEQMLPGSPGRGRRPPGGVGGDHVVSDGERSGHFGFPAVRQSYDPLLLSTFIDVKRT